MPEVTTWVQGEVRERFETPDDLVWAIRSRPRTVRFDGEPTMGTTWSGRIADLPTGMTVTIWGRHHLWKVTVSRGRRGFKVTQWVA